jgi:hypothetical protein
MQQQKLHDRIHLLEAQHAQLDREIQEAYTEYLDDDQLTELKRQKLFIKDTLTQLRTQLVDK